MFYSSFILHPLFILSMELREILEQLYQRFNRREFVHPDPLECLYRYDDLRDREIAALVASSLASGRVAQILRSVSMVLEIMQAPHEYLKRATRETLRRDFRDFKHRFTTGEELALMLCGVKGLLERYGSLQESFAAGLKRGHETVIPALSAFVSRLADAAGGAFGPFIPSPVDGSACKRLNLFLRWMVRRDEVDPGGWDNVPASKLVVPLDIHLHRISLRMKLSERKQKDMRTALEITAAFKTFAPEDPVRYDFVLTRLGIRNVLWPGGAS